MNQLKAPLYEKLMEHINNNPISFHVPGHKNGLLIKEIDVNFSNMMNFDVTELSNLDDLHDPQGAIREAEQLLSDLYRSKKSYFLVNGSTVGNLAMILATCEEGDIVLVDRNCHKSILNGLKLANVTPVFITPDLDQNIMASGINVATIKEAYQCFPTIKACIFTYPDYYGRTFELKEIINIVHSHGSLVLIDEAHGPHFQLGKPFPTSSLQLGADIVVHSAHKMLPAMTMGSFLHINSNRVSINKVKLYLSILQSSSPSYPIMASLDFARSYLANFSQEDIHYTMRKRNDLIDKLNHIKGFTVGPIKNNQDPLKITLRHKDLTGFDLQEELEKLSIYPELADMQQVLLLLPLLKKGMEFPYEQALEKLSTFQAIQSKSLKPMNIDLEKEDKMNTLALSYKEMSKLSYHWVDMDHAVGKIAAKMIIPYPPGIPLFLQGEKITEGKIQLLHELFKANARFQGDMDKLNLGKIAVFKE